jgi:hypothetical protein
MMAMARWPSFIDERCRGGIVYSWLFLGQEEGSVIKI